MAPSIDALRDHALAQLEPQLTRTGSLRIVSTLLSMLDDRGILETESLVATAFEDFEKYLDEEPTSRRTAFVAALAFMAGEDRDSAIEAFERLLGDDVPHGLRAEVGGAVSRVDRYLQHLGLLRRDLIHGAQVEPSLYALLGGLEGDVAQVRHSAQEASRRAVGVRSATRVLAFLEEPPPTFFLEPDALEDETATAGEPVEATDPSLLESLLRAAEVAWRDGRFVDAKAALDRVLGRDVLHDERDVSIRLGAVLRSRSYSDLACAREAKRELAVVTVGRLAECPASEVRQVLSLVHRCDPVGVAARDDAESVRLQAAWDGAPRLVVDLADRALEAFEGDISYPTLTELFDLPADELKAVRATMRRYRASAVERLVAGAEASYDLSFFREGPEFLQGAGWRGEVPAEPTEQLEALGKAILARIEPFMRYGLERLEPIEVAELADAAGLTFDQVGRVGEGVLVDTPWGIVALRHFMRSSPRLGALGD